LDPQAHPPEAGRASDSLHEIKMGLDLKGYVLEPVRVSPANAAFTATPNNCISDQAAFDAAYPQGSEPNPRVEYLTLVLTDGLLVDAEFGWTKNEVISRFDYDSKGQRYKLLPGAPPVAVGAMRADANTDRFKVTSPTQVLAAAPYRLTLGGTNFPVDLVTVFGSPSSGNVEILTTTGELNWHAADVMAYSGQDIVFQQQQFYAWKDSTGSLGLLSTTLSLNPLPATGQHPLLRIGFGQYLTPIEVASFTFPASGEVQWHVTTGELRFNPADVVTNVGKLVYYDGVLLGYKLQLPRQVIGFVPAAGSPTPLAFTGIPSEGGDLIFRLPTENIQFPATAWIDATATFDTTGSAGTVVVKPVGANGQALLSFNDRTLYAGKTVEVVFGDLPLERGISMRFFRCSANPAGSDATIKDVTSNYTVVDATLASPIVGAPLVILPAVPLDDGTLTVKITQGTGWYLDPAFRRLDTLPLPTSAQTLGYTLDFEKGQIFYAQRRNNFTTYINAPAGAAQLTDPLLNAAYLNLELNTGSGFAPLTIGADALVDLNSGVVSFTATQGTEVTTGHSGAFNGTAFTDTSADFSSVLPGDTLTVLSGTSMGVYTVVTVPSGTSLTTDVGGGLNSGLSYEIRHGKEVLADRFWQEALPLDPGTYVERIVSLGLATNTPRIPLPTPFRKGSNVYFADSVTVTTVPTDADFSAPSGMAPDTVEVSLTTGNLNLKQAALLAPRFRFGSSLFSSSVAMVSDDANFGAPLQGSVEVSLTTGNLNFNPSDIGTTVYCARRLQRRIDYKLTPYLGFFDFTSRFLVSEEALITYRPETDTGPGPTVSERATFLIRKELTQAHPDVTNTTSFNPDGHQVATEPPPAVFRGGRPQTSSQVAIDVIASTIRFLPDTIVSDVLPHGATLNPDERVYIDYYVYDAVGGEKTTTILQPPMATAQVILQEGADNFMVSGDQTAIYPTGYLLRVEQLEVHLIGSSVYDVPTDTTTVTLGYGQAFDASATDPKLYVASGATRLGGFLWNPSYFVTEATAFETIPRGMNRFSLSGDRSIAYRSGTVLLFSDATSTFIDTYQVSGVTFDAAASKTIITLSMNVLRQYTPGTHVLKYSVRPILGDQAIVAQTSMTPILTQPYAAYRRLEGQVGQMIYVPTGYTISDAGQVTLTSPLLPTEEITIFYTGHRMVPANSALKASYTSAIVPTVQNGLLGQVLKADYTLYSPDSFYHRVELLSNFQAEIAAQFETDAKGASPSGGPNTSNAIQPKLYEQGRESVYFPEGHLANADIVMRAFLKYHNDLVNCLEDVLQNVDGRVVGDIDGRFKFDGKTDNPVRATWSNVTNQIDDIMCVSPFPIKVTPPFPPTITYIGTYQKVYLPGKWSRFFPSYRASLFGITVAGHDTNAADNDWILALGWNPISSMAPVAFRRWPRALIVKDAKAGDTVLYVDNATGATVPVLRPSFPIGMKALVASRTMTYVSDAAPLTVVGVVPGPPDQLQVIALPADVPSGATVYLCTTGVSKDTTVLFNYRVHTDINVDLLNGMLTYIEPYFPFDGSIPLIPAELNIQAPDSNEILQVNGVSVSYSALEPYRFPALDGKAISDCIDQAVPMFQTPEQELLMLTHVEDAIPNVIADTSATTLLTGDLNLARTIITATAPFAAPFPQVHDLVRITTGSNSTAGFRRISVVGANTITVDTPFTTVDTGFDFVITAASNLHVGSFLLVDPSTLQDLGPLPVLQVGHTAVLTNGNNVGVRRQIVGVDYGTNELSLDYPITLPNTSTTYRVYNPLSTYSNLVALNTADANLASVLATNDHNLVPTVIDSEILALQRALDGDPIIGTDGVLTDILPGGSSSGTVSGSTLTDALVDFQTLGVSTAHYVYVETGGNQGLYVVASVTGPTTLDIDGTFPVGAVIQYRIVSVYGLSKPSLQDICCVLKKAQTFYAALNAFWVITNTVEPVVLPSGTDPNVFATRLLSTDLVAWSSAVTDRETFLNDPNAGALARVTNILATSEKLYDKRYTWIDARLNRKTGVTAKRDFSIADRHIKTVEQKKSLDKAVAINQLKGAIPPSQAEKDYDPNCV
jgi:hypothetical protein